jgi:hypothetical protein
VAHDRDQPRPLGQCDLLDRLAGTRRVLPHGHLDDLEVFPLELEQVDQPVLRYLVLDQGHDRAGGGNRRRNPEQLEIRFVAGIVHACDHGLDAVVLAGKLADDHVVLVVAGDGDHDVGRALDPRAFEHEELGCVALVHLMLELRLEHVEPDGPLLDQRHLVARPDQRPREVRADLSPACDQEIHLAERTFEGTDGFGEGLDRVRGRADDVEAA